MPRGTLPRPVVRNPGRGRLGLPRTPGLGRLGVGPYNPVACPRAAHIQPPSPPGRVVTLRTAKLRHRDSCHLFVPHRTPSHGHHGPHHPFPDNDNPWPAAVRECLNQCADEHLHYLIRSLRRKDVRMASGWRQDSVRMASGGRQGGVRMASGWRQDGVRMRQDGRQDAVRMMGSLASGWRQVASDWVRMASGKRQNSVRMASGSVRVASGWHQGGVKTLWWRQDGVTIASGEHQDSVRMVQPGPDGISGCQSGLRGGYLPEIDYTYKTKCGLGLGAAAAAMGCGTGGMVPQPSRHGQQVAMNAYNWFYNRTISQVFVSFVMLLA